MKNLYTIGAQATGGRNGQVKSENNVLDLEVRMPKALGGANDDYANPEMLFAAGYAACFDSALNLVIKQSKVQTGETTVTAKVSIGQLEKAQALTEKAHQVCPYSNATRGNIEVKISVSNQ